MRHDLSLSFAHACGASGSADAGEIARHGAHWVIVVASVLLLNSPTARAESWRSHPALSSPDALLRVNDGTANGYDAGTVRDFFRRYDDAGVTCDVVSEPVHRLRTTCRDGRNSITYTGSVNQYGDLIIDKAVVKGRVLMPPFLADIVAQIIAGPDEERGQ